MDYGTRLNCIQRGGDTAAGDRYVQSVNKRKVGSARNRLEDNLYISSENKWNIAEENGPDNIKGWTGRCDKGALKYVFKFYIVLVI
jgi:hypothetical protein